MKRIMMLSLLLLFSFPVFLSAQQEPTYENLSSPVDTVASYYDAINHQEYQLAYSYWETAPNSYNDFVDGFADTVSVQLIVQPPVRAEGAAGSVYVQIPTVLIAEHEDGTKLTFSGCFVTRKSNIQEPNQEESDWHLYSAQFKETESTDIPTLLSEGCESQ